MMAAILHAAKDARRRAMMAVARGVLSAIDDTQQLQSLQLDLLDGETADTIERFENYGFSAVPYPGAEAVMLSVGGLRSHGVVVAVGDRRYRLTGGAPGEVVMHDDQGQKVHLQRAGVLITSPQKVTVHSDVEVDVTAPKVVITSDDVELGAAGGMAVARVGDLVDLGAGTISSGSAKVTCA
ncbi:MAG: phage baseplate assembly protein V [Caulobacteraceae bacterium]